MMFDLTGRTALVTGATGGIGNAIARALHAQGATVAISGVTVRRLRKSSIFSGITAKRRIESIGPSSATGGITQLTREPSGSRASTIGLDSSTRRPMLETILSMIFITWALSRKVIGVSSSLPLRST